jgi:hypothetical protein
MGLMMFVTSAVSISLLISEVEIIKEKFKVMNHQAMMKLRKNLSKQKEKHYV